MAEGEYIREMSPDRQHELVVHVLARAGIDTHKYPLPYVSSNQRAAPPAPGQVSPEKIMFNLAQAA